MPRLDSVLIVIPTYNECDNISALASQLLTIVPEADILFVDDSSPDGTGEVADELHRLSSSIHVLHRPNKEGLGRAYIAGFRWGLAHGYGIFVQMDADLSHDPRAVPLLLDRLETAQMVLGSRYIAGGGTRHWGYWRRAISRFGSHYARLIIGLPYRDLTGGFKCWRREALAAIDLDTVSSCGYSFQIETTHRAALRGLTIAEVPIVFYERTSGQSKMTPAIVREAIGVVWRLRRERLISEYRTCDSASGTEAST
jgi:dolichol-phosphate mannosyltransferase